MLRLAVFLCLTLFASEAVASRIVEGNETWSGRVVLDGNVVVPAGATLTIRPGTELRFAPNVGLAVEGRLLAKGSAAKPIVFRPATGSNAASWQGISVTHGSREGSELVNVRIEGAAQALNVVGSKVRIASSTLLNGNKGVVSGGGAYVVVDGVTVRDMSEGGVDASVQTQGEVVGCRIERVAGFGIQVAKQAALSIRNNRFSGGKFGILLSGDSPPVEGNVLDGCEVGIALVQASPKTIVRGNKVTKAKTGIGCQQFSSPTLQGNTVEDCDKGIECFQASSPLVQQNRLARNRSALFCVQMCNPMVARNDFVDNQTAAYLHLSSYAQFRENNFEGNGLHIELDNMSYDWELRAKKKPKRQRQAQNEVLAQQGRAVAENIQVDVASEGFVDARENYWGEKTTTEMEAKGTSANILAIKDGFDVPTRTYEGWPGEYKQDRVRYDDWKKKRIPGTGPVKRQ